MNSGCRATGLLGCFISSPGAEMWKNYFLNNKWVNIKSLLYLFPGILISASILGFNRPIFADFYPIG